MAFATIFLVFYESQHFLYLSKVFLYSPIYPLFNPSYNRIPLISALLTFLKGKEFHAVASCSNFFQETSWNLLLEWNVAIAMKKIPMGMHSLFFTNFAFFLNLFGIRISKNITFINFNIRISSENIYERWGVMGDFFWSVVYLVDCVRWLVKLEGWRVIIFGRWCIR